MSEVFPGIDSVDVTLLRAYDRRTGTSLDPDEILCLAAVVRFTSPERILEIGTYAGNTTLNLAANSPASATIVTVDLPPDWDGRLALDVPDAYVNVTERTTIGSQYRNTPYAKKITQVFGDSAKIDWTELPVPFDIVFIDGCHAYDYVRIDTRNAIRFLRSGGMVIWHDYGLFPDVSKVVDATARDMRVRAIRGTRLAVGFVE